MQLSEDSFKERIGLLVKDPTILKRKSMVLLNILLYPEKYQYFKALIYKISAYNCTKLSQSYCRFISFPIFHQYLQFFSLLGGCIKRTLCTHPEQKDTGTRCL